LAEALGQRGVKISRQQVSDWTRGAVPKGSAAAFLAEVLGVTGDWLWLGLPVDQRERERALQAERAARAIRHCVLTGNTLRLQLLSDWLHKLAEDLEHLDPTYDTLELRRAADDVRNLIG